MFDKPMKAYGFLLAFTAVLVAVLFAIPQLVGSTLTHVRAVTVARGAVQTSVDCSGTIVSKHERSVYYARPLMIGKVLVEVGRKVEAGQKLVEIDRETTLEAAQAGNTASSFPVTSGSYSSLLAQYGGNAALASAAAAAASSGAAASSKTGAGDVPTVIRAPISGVVTQLNAEEGSYTDATDPVVVIADTGDLQIKAQVDEILAAGVKVGQKASITGDGFKTAYTGAVTKIFPAARQVTDSSGTRTVVDVLLRIDSPGGDLKPGLTADVSINTTGSAGSLTVPYEAVNQDGDNREYVYVLREGRAYKTIVRTGDENATSVSVTSGLSSGDRVIVGAPEGLRDGQAVIAEVR